jgi:hypothetical protein
MIILILSLLGSNMSACRRSLTRIQQLALAVLS